MIYLDAAATTLEKPPQVRQAMAQAAAELSTPGRGSHPAARRAEETAFRCRAEAAALFGVPSPENVVFTMNATHGLNIAIRSLVAPGSRVVISGYEHNAVCRPLYAIPEVRLTVVDAPPFRREQAAEEFRRAILAGADAVIVNHVSNVFGCVQPLEEIAGVCRSRGGLLLCGERPARPLLLGGTGSASRDRQMPPTLPDRLEAGTHNMPGIAGLLEGLRFVRRRTPEAIACRERQLAAEAVRRLKALPGVEVFTPANGPHPTGVVSFRAAGRDCEELAEALGRRGIALRAGLHCAPLAHRTVGTLDTGTVRLSLSDFNTPAQIEKLAQELHPLCRETVRYRSCLRPALQIPEVLGEESVPGGVQVGAEGSVGLQQEHRLLRQLRSAAAPSPHGGMQQLDAQDPLRGLDDGPRLGVGHVHGLGRRAQRMKLLHMAQQLGDARTEALLPGEQADGIPIR